jgi:hypothetical protein
MALTAAQKKKIRERLAQRLKERGYKKGRLSKKTGKKISDVKLAKKKPATWKKVGDKWEKTVYNDDGTVKSKVTKSQSQYDAAQSAKKFHTKHVAAVRKKDQHKKLFKTGAQEGKRVQHQETKTGKSVQKVDASLKGKFTSKEHVSKWGTAKKKQLASLKKSGKLSASDYATKLEKVQKRITHGKKKYG